MTWWTRITCISVHIVHVCTVLYASLPVQSCTYAHVQYSGIAYGINIAYMCVHVCSDTVCGGAWRLDAPAYVVAQCHCRWWRTGDTTFDARSEKNSFAYGGTGDPKRGRGKFLKRITIEPATKIFRYYPYALQKKSQKIFWTCWHCWTRMLVLLSVRDVEGNTVNSHRIASSRLGYNSSPINPSIMSFRRPVWNRGT